MKDNNDEFNSSGDGGSGTNSGNSGNTPESKGFSLSRWYNEKTYNQKFLILFAGILALIIIVAVILHIIDINTELFGKNGMNWYGFMVGVAIVLCVLLGQFSATKNGIYNDIVFDYAIISIIFAMIGARVYYVIFTDSSISFWDFGSGGFAVYGGLIGAVIGVLAAMYLWRGLAALSRKYPEHSFFGKMPQKPRVKFIQCMDLAFTFVPLGQAIGRWGCYAAGCCYGVELTDPAYKFLPFAYQPVGHTDWHLPTFLYESVFCVLLFAFLLYAYLGKRKSFNGFYVSVYCIGYGLCRFILEGFRAESAVLYMIPDVLRVSQFVSILIMAFGVIWIAQYIVRAKLKGKKLMIFVSRNKLSDEYFEYNKTIYAHPHVNWIDGSPLEPGADMAVKEGK